DDLANETDAQASQKARVCAEIAGDRQAALLCLGVPALTTELSARTGVSEQQGMYAKSIGSTSASITGPKTPINQPDDESGSSRRGRFNASFPPMTRSPTFSPAVENTTPPRTSGPVSPKAEPTWADVTGLAMANNHAYRRASLNPSRFPPICTCQVDGAQAG